MTETDADVVGDDAVDEDTVDDATFDRIAEDVLDAYAEPLTRLTT